MEKIALVTGANKGIGLETVRQLAKQGVLVVLGARNENRLMQAVNQLKQEGLVVEGLLIDLENPATFDPAAQRIARQWGKLDILINNAGVQLELPEWTGNTADNIQMETLRKTFEVNFFGVVELTQRLLFLLKKSNAGRIVNVSSIMGSLTLHNDPSSPIYDSKPFAYDASKTALNQYTVHLAAALKDTNIRVNSAHPGWIKTDLGTEYAPTDVTEGVDTIISLALAGHDSPNGAFMYKGEHLPW